MAILSPAQARVATKYKRLILLGKVRLPVEAARTLVGPDCAYHLYFAEHDEAEPATGKARPRGRRGRSRPRRG